MKALLTATALLLAQLAEGPPQPMSSGSLVIQVVNGVPDRGAVLIAVFEAPEAYEARSPALRSVVLPVDATGDVSWRLDDLPPGSYAAVAYQDLNDNRLLDKGRFGIPKEPYGFTNSPKTAFGPPPFEQARFAYGGADEQVDIHLKRRERGQRSEAGPP